MLVHPIDASIDTLHFENACLQRSNDVQLRLRCSSYEHIKIVRIIYGYSKQSSIEQCRFSIYDCIQEGKSQHIQSCNGQQICSIKLTRDDIYMSTVVNSGVPNCPKLNYVQVNFGCVPDANDICDSWRDDGPILHLSHVASTSNDYNQCQCKVRSSLANGQVLLHAKGLSKSNEHIDDMSTRTSMNVDCKKTTYIEIATDRSERKCMDNLPTHGNALFGSGSQNFTLNYIRNDRLNELYFHFELKASPVKKDHHVQIICNWARRTTTTRRTTHLLGKRRRTSTTRPNRSNHFERKQDRTTYVNDKYSSLPSTIESLSLFDDEQETMSIRPLSSTIDDNDEQWLRIESTNDIDWLSSSVNRTSTSSMQASLLSNDDRSFSRLSNRKMLRIFLITSPIVVVLFIFYCFVRRQAHFIRRLQLHVQLAMLFCCEAGKLLFSSSTTHSPSIGSQPTETMTHHQSSYPASMIDYQTSAYYMNDPMQNCHMTPSIYDAASDDRQSMSSMTYVEHCQRNVSRSKYDSYRTNEHC
jgi:hypothetical protein